ncbi:LytTR family DNA-binding domain-containing protein [Holzapfeliella floricola]|uniref:HTH LytTR-type domain-containing protein n=1 Tax=Holzapfeliella floricola DSM 23037 = JCM 16512 TaxID=1423744 RepID=A0A0R2DM15_9LACO|nr:LytTR family DNA-binding domain-containing protein [Holzapfeliella floricola]KRN04710.1 hypothetical protein FC86_GL001066 [Holzapfeliella floricola DSM 23037 = JCM 16512]
MKVEFIPDKQLAKDVIELDVRASELTPNVQNLISQLINLDNKAAIIPIKEEDCVIILKPSDIIFVDVISNELLIYTQNKTYQIKERLNRFSERLGGYDFVQVSKHALVNLNHLISLENSFSGNMLAILTADYKTDVSRKYLGLLKQKLGI